MRWCLLWAMVASLWMATPAEARRSSDYSYRYEQVWRAAVRLIRVDYGFAIQDRDQEIGYLIFEYRNRSSSQTHDGSLELVRATQDGRDTIRVVLQVQGMPSYVERMILDKLGRKLLEDYGEPLRPRRPQEPEHDEDDEPEPGEEPPPEDGTP